MREPRRTFLWCAGAVLSGTVLQVRAAAQNPKRQFPTPPQAADQSTPAGDKRPAVANVAIARERDKAFRECLTALSTRVNQLNQELEAQPSAHVYSVSVYKQTGEIEKLAKQLRNLAKG